jgi:hypothetical protein
MPKGQRGENADGKILVTLGRELYDQLVEFAEEDDRTPGQVAKRAIKAHVRGTPFRDDAA